MRLKHTDVWFSAAAESRNYITPEDVIAARKFGAVGEDFLRVVLKAIAMKRAEDPSACAFAATRRLNRKSGRSPEPVRITTEAEADAYFGEHSEMAEWAKWYVRKAATLDVRGALIRVVPGLKGGSGLVELTSGES